MKAGDSSRELGIVYASVVVYAVCYMAQAPLLPYLTRQFGGDDMSYGWLQTAFSALQFMGGLLSGPFVDRYGGRALLVVSYLVSSLCYFLTAAATNMATLYVSRLATLLQHAVLAARTIATARTRGAARAAALGYVGASYGVGFALGPALGGLLSSHSLQAAAWVAGAVSLAGAGALLALLPPDAGGGAAAAAAAASAAGPAGRGSAAAPGAAGGAPPPSPPGPAQGAAASAAAAGGASPAPPRALDLASLVRVVAAPGVPQLLLVKACSGVCLAMLSSTFSLVLAQRYQLDSKQNGWVLSYLGGCMVFAQALLIRPAQRLLGEGGASAAGCALMALAFLGMSGAGPLWQLLVCVAPLAAGGTVLATVNTAQLTHAVPPALAGTMVAVDMSLGSGVRMVAPLAGVALLRRLGWPLLCGALGAALAPVAALAWAAPRRKPAAAHAPADKKEE